MKARVIKFWINCVLLGAVLGVGVTKAQHQWLPAVRAAIAEVKQ